MVERVMRDCSWSVLRQANVVGNTAEDLAIRNKQFKCARILQVKRERKPQVLSFQYHRLHMVSCLNRQLYESDAVRNKHWTMFSVVFKVAEKWVVGMSKNFDALISDGNPPSLVRMTNNNNFHCLTVIWHGRRIRKGNVKRRDNTHLHVLSLMH
jgi:hypothetical protein